MAVVPLAQSEAGPPQPGPIEQPAVHPATGGQYYPGRDTLNPPPSGPRNIPDPLEDDDGPVPVGQRSNAVVLSVAVPMRTFQVLAWAADAAGMPAERYVVQCLAGVAASMKPEWRKATSGRAGGSVRARDIGSYTE